ncbi:MAG: type I-C CRISPR-associated protein Cas5 [Chloroflexia bacterium]|nr:type I-C CRISPR-associated protein Cas5 [Chloroflexia bacterium]
MNDDVPLTIKVWGDWACFTRPELKVERVTYPVMTPSAARGVLEAILWKPEFQWEVREIWLLKPVRFFSILRNEVNNRQSDRSARNWERSGGGYDATEDRAQRHTLALRDVAYVIVARPWLNDGVGAHVAKYRDQFRRRVQRGQCFATPYLGCREFSAGFGPVEGGDKPLDVSFEIGRMLAEITHAADGSGVGTPRFFDAAVRNGVLSPPEVERTAA